MLKHTLLLVLFTLALCKDPPILADSFLISFEQIEIIDNTNYTVNGQMFYDADNNRERVDRVDGRYDQFCGSVLPDIDTPCQHLTVNGKRNLIFP